MGFRRDWRRIPNGGLTCPHARSWSATWLRQVREASGAREHRWQEGLPDDLTAELVAHVTVWRAAMGVPEDDLRPTGSAQPPSAASRWQHVLEDHLELANPALQHWKAMVRQLAPQLRTDPHTPVLAAKLGVAGDAGERRGGGSALVMRRGTLPPTRPRGVGAAVPARAAIEGVDSEPWSPSAELRHRSTEGPSLSPPRPSRPAPTSAPSACARPTSARPAATESASDPHPPGGTPMTAQPKPANQPVGVPVDRRGGRAATTSPATMSVTASSTVRCLLSDQAGRSSVISTADLEHLFRPVQSMRSHRHLMVLSVLDVALIGSPARRTGAVTPAVGQARTSTTLPWESM